MNVQVFIVLDESPDDVRFFLVEMKEEDLEIFKTVNALYVNGCDVTKEEADIINSLQAHCTKEVQVTLPLKLDSSVTVIHTGFFL